MSANLARVFCPDCEGESSTPANPPCGWCHSSGHLDIDRAADGTVPMHHPDGRLVRPWVDALFDFDTPFPAPAED